MPSDREQIHMPHDTGYKYLLSSKKAFIQLIRSFIKTGWAEQVDETNLVRIDKSFILQDFQNKEADLIYRAKLKEKDVIFYVLMELQSTVDFLIPYRLLLYMTEIWRDIFKNISQKEAERKGFRLPVIVPIVLYNGQETWNVPLNFKETLDGFELFMEHVLDFRYNLISVSSYDQEELLELSSLMGAVFLLDQAKDLEEVIERLKKLLVTIKKMEAEEYRLFTAWAENILTRGGVSSEKKDEITVILGKTRPEEVEEMISNVERVLKKSWQDAEKQGIEKGMQKGIEKGMQKVAKQMLSEGENIEKITKYTGLSREVIEKLR
ncbi:MAG: Rpn family recombination-promoting nuclease/putative transposase [Erysipelotrichaceae bacterium]|nr:Rpn family recombination-promoting nuclease/putative transposase [Erysipelotrichaceae bacterium]